MNNDSNRRPLQYLGPAIGPSNMFGGTSQIPDSEIQSNSGHETIIQDFSRIRMLLEDPSTNRRELLSDRMFRIGRSSNGSYISDVFQCGDEGNAEQLCRNFQVILREQHPRGFYIISIHGTHVHVVHDCPYSDRSCRCSFIKKAQGGIIRSKRPFRRAPRISTLKVSDYANIIVYFSTKGRKVYEIRLAGQVEKISDGIENMGEREIEGSGTTHEMESCFNVDSPELRREITYALLDARCSKAYRDSTQAKSKKSEKIQQLVLDMCLKYPCSPVNGIVTTHLWLMDKHVKFLGTDDLKVKAGLTAFGNRICSWTFEDFNAMYKTNNCKPFFTACVMPFDSVYYNIDDSIAVLIKLLNFQFNDNNEEILRFMTDLYHILDRKIPKRNCILLHSPPSGGKNFFMDVFIDYFLNKGQFGNANKHNNFAFQDAFGKRIILWNEPNYERSKIDTVKMITAGDAYSVNVKMKSNSAVCKTPIIVLTNNSVDMMTNPAFRDRVYVYRWKMAPFLKDYTKKPNPLAAFELLVHYKLIEDNVDIIYE